MNCPKCGSVIAGLGRYCTGCGHDFGEELYDKLSFYFGLKDEFEKLTKLQTSLYAGIANVSVKIQKYEEVLRRDLEKQSASLTAPPHRPPVTSRPHIPNAVPTVSTAAADMTAQPVSFAGRSIVAHDIPKGSASDFETRLGQKWLLIIGLLTMVFGVGYFLKYSFDQGWVGPAGRVAMAYVWGIAFLIAGNAFRRKDFEAFGLSLVGGFLTPVLLTTGQDNQLALMTYMTILNLGLLGIAFYKKWDLLNALGFAFTYLLYTGWFVSYYKEPKFWPAILFLNVFYLIYSIVPFAYQFLRNSSERVQGYLIMVPNSFIAFAFSYGMIKSHFSLPWVSVISLFYATVFLAMASLLARKGKQNQEAFVVLLGNAALFLIITVPLLFSKQWITIFWAAQALVLLWMGIKLGRRALAGGAYALFGITVYKFLFHDYSMIFRFSAVRDFSFLNSYLSLLPERFITTVLLLAALYGAGSLAARASLRIVTPELNDSAALFSVWAALLFIVLNIETAAFFHEYLPAARFAALSVLWTVFAVVLMIKGIRGNISLLRKVSFALFLITILKVFFFDMSNVSTPYRIVSFIILGLVLVGTSYLYYKFKDRMIAVPQDRKKES